MGFADGVTAGSESSQSLSLPNLQARAWAAAGFPRSPPWHRVTHCQAAWQCRGGAAAGASHGTATGRLARSADSDGPTVKAAHCQCQAGSSAALASLEGNPAPGDRDRHGHGDAGAAQPARLIGLVT